jgi:hypothetical protein
MLCKAFRGVMATRRSLSVRVSSVLTAVLVVFAYGYLFHYHDNSQPKHMLDDNIRLPTHTRHLLSYRGRVDSNYGYDIDGNYSNVPSSLRQSTMAIAVSMYGTTAPDKLPSSTTYHSLCVTWDI